MIAAQRIPWRGPRARGVALGAAVAVVYLGARLLLVWRFPPFTDESLYASWALRGFESPEQRFVSLANGKEPLLPWLGTLAMHLGLEPLTAVRLVSVGAGAVTVSIVALLGRALGGARVALAAAAIAAALPFFVVYDSLGLYESLATAFVACALYLQLRLARELRLDHALLLGLVLAGGLLTKETTISALVLLPVSLLCFDWAPVGRGRRLARWCGLVAVALVLAWLGRSVMMLSELYDDLGRLREQLYPTHSVGEALAHPGRWLEENWPENRKALFGYVTVPLVLTAAVGFAFAVRLWRARALVLLAWAALPVLAATLLADEPFPRYLQTALPAVAVFAGFGLVALLELVAGRIRDGRARRAALVVVALALATQALWFDARVLASPRTAHYPASDDQAFVTGAAAGGPWSAVADELRRRAAGRPLLVVQGENVSEFLPLELRHDPGIGFVRAGEERAASALLAVENSSAFPLPPRTDGLAWRLVRGFERPRGGVPVSVYESGVPRGARFAASPDELRRLIGGTDADYDAFLQAHPAVHAWADAWYAAHPA